MFLYKTQLSAKRRTDDLIFSGRSLIKMRNRTGPKTDPWGTPDRTETGSKAWPSNTTLVERPVRFRLPEWAEITRMDYRNGS